MVQGGGSWPGIPAAGGAPVVAYDHGPLRDLGAPWLIASDDPSALVGAAVRLARDPERRAGIVSAQRVAVQERFSARVVARAYERVYDKLLRSRAPG